MKLAINTILPTHNEVTLDTQQGQKTVRTPDDTEQFFEFIVNLVESNHVAWQEINEISVVPGPGVRFTRTRQGVTIANGLAFALHCQVNQAQFVMPTYHKEPNITV